MTYGITKRQAEARDFIARHIGDHGYPPTLREIGEAMGVTSTNSVSGMLASMERKGLIVRTKGTARGLALTKAGWTQDRPDAHVRGEE